MERVARGCTTHVHQMISAMQWHKFAQSPASLLPVMQAMQAQMHARHSWEGVGTVIMAEGTSCPPAPA